MGGSPDPPNAPPAPPSNLETSAQAIQAQIDALPKILEAQRQYGGQFSQEQLDSLSKYGPQFAQAALDLEERFAPQYKRISDTLNPEIGLAQKGLADYLGGNDQAEFEALSPGLLEQVRAGQSERGLGAISPLGSIDESVQLQQLKQSLKDRRLNVQLSTAGRVPIGGIANVQGQTGTSQLVQNVSPNDIFSNQHSINAFNASIFNTQGSIFGSQAASSGNPFGSILGGITGGASGAFGTKVGNAIPFFCWVAATVFDGWDDPRTHNARRFILMSAPDWLRLLYIKYGESIANFISTKPILKAIIKPFFSWMAQKGAL